MAEAKNMQEQAAQAQAVQKAQAQAAESQEVQGQTTNAAPELHNMGAWRQVEPGTRVKSRRLGNFIPEDNLRAQHQHGGEALYSAFVEALVSAFVFLALAFGMQAAISQLTAPVLVFVAGVVACVGASALGIAGVKSATRQLGAVAAAVLLLVAVLFVPQLSSAFAQFTNAFVYSINDLFDMFIPLSSPAAQPAGEVCAVCVGLALGLVAWLLVSLRSAVVTGLLVAFVVGYGTVLGMASGVASYVCAAFALGLNVQYSLQRRTVSVARGAWVCLLVAVMVVAGGALAVLYSPASVVDVFRESTNNAIGDARYGTDSLPQGNVTASASMNDDGEASVMLSFSELPSHDLYLRGYTGANLEGTQWEDLDHTAYEGSWQGMVSWLESRGFSSETQYASYQSISQANGATAISTYDVQVNTQNARSQYVYAPASLVELSDADADQNRDDLLASTKPAGAVNYSASAYDVDNWLDAAPAWLTGTGTLTDSEAAQYLESEAVYRAFVNENYLSISDEDKEAATRLFFSGDTWEGGDEASIASIASRVQAMLATLASYDTTPVVYTGQEEFLTWFCEDERAGNSAYFATAAVMAFRSQGIPARYAEGYLFTESELASLAASGTTQATIDASNAHAWVEVYRDGIGWVPVEVTPGFYQQQISANKIVQVNQESSSGDADNPSAEGSVAGDVPESDTEQPTASISPLVVLALVLVVLVVLALAAWGIAEWRRSRALARHKAALASSDQLSAVRARFDELSYMLLASGVDFDVRRAPECHEAVAAVFGEVRPEEYARVMSLYQKSVFGSKELAANELRAIDRFNERIASACPAPATTRQKLQNRYRYLR